MSTHETKDPKLINCDKNSYPPHLTVDISMVREWRTVTSKPDVVRKLRVGRVKGNIHSHIIRWAPFLVFFCGLSLSAGKFLGIR